MLSTASDKGSHALRTDLSTVRESGCISIRSVTCTVGVALQVISGATASAVPGVVLCKETCLEAAASAAGLSAVWAAGQIFYMSQIAACAANIASQEPRLLTRVARRLLCANATLGNAGRIQESCNADPHATVCSMCSNSSVVAVTCMIDTFVM